MDAFEQDSLRRGPARRAACRANPLPRPARLPSSGTSCGDAVPGAAPPGEPGAAPGLLPQGPAVVACDHCKLAPCAARLSTYLQQRPAVAVGARPMRHRAERCWGCPRVGVAAPSAEHDVYKVYVRCGTGCPRRCLPSPDGDFDASCWRPATDTLWLACDDVCDVLRVYVAVAPCVLTSAPGKRRDYGVLLGLLHARQATAPPAAACLAQARCSHCVAQRGTWLLTLMGAVSLVLRQVWRVRASMCVAVRRPAGLVRFAVARYCAAPMLLRCCLAWVPAQLPQRVRCPALELAAPP